MPAKPTQVFLLVDSSHTRVIQEGQTPTDMACYAHPIQGTIEETVQSAWLERQIPPGSTVLVTTDARCDAYTVEPTLVPA